MTSQRGSRAHIVYSESPSKSLPRAREAFFPAILTLETTISLFYVTFGDIIWLMLYLELCNTKRLVTMEGTYLRFSGYHGRLSGSYFFSQVSKQNGFKLQEQKFILL